MYSSRRGQYAVWALWALLAAGCASMNVSSYAARGMDVTRYRTYNWGPTDGISTGDPRLDNNPFFNERVQAEVERRLAGRGFRKAASETPDVVVHYHASVTQRIDADTIDRERGYGDVEGRRRDVYDAGTLVVDLIDTRTNALVWRGWAEDSVAGAIDNQEWMEAKIDEAVRRIFERLPRT